MTRWQILAQLAPLLGDETIASGVTALLGRRRLQAFADQAMGRRQGQ